MHICAIGVIFVYLYMSVCVRVYVGMCVCVGVKKSLVYFIARKFNKFVCGKKTSAEFV